MINMGEYKYSDEEKDRNKVLKLHDNQLRDIQQQREDIQRSLDDAIKSTEEFIQSRGYDTKPTVKVVHNTNHSNRCQLVDKTWSEIVDEADRKIRDAVELEDVLSKAEIDAVQRDLQKIRDEFSRVTNLNRTDLNFLVIATALQTIRWIVMPKIGQTVDQSTRLNHDDPSIKAEIKKKNQEFKDKYIKNIDNQDGWEVAESEKGYKNWLDIIFNSIPYDATKGSPLFDVNMEAGYHRYKTLGHDPILGWIFGVANIVTDTITLPNFSSYRVKSMKFSENVLLSTVFSEFRESIDEDFHRLPAAIFAQGVHLASDKYTKLGLPIPILSVFSTKLAGKLYRKQYDALCFEKDVKKVGSSATVAVLINMIIGLVHGFFYNEETDISRDLYEVRTRKILSLSNSLATTSNLIAVAITKNPKLLDIGGLLVTISRLFTDVRFISKIQDEFIHSEINKQFLNEIKEVDRLYESIRNGR